MSMSDYIIIGAGLSGLNTAKKIKELNLGSCLILEKSRGVGGRMATRRAFETRFDHGAQFYRVKVDIKEQHQQWKKADASHHWFTSVMGEHWCAKSGMTTLAKELGAGLDIQLQKLIHTISYDNHIWTLTSDQGESWKCHHLIITAPLPQIIQIIERSNLTSGLISEEFNELRDITYTKALVALVTLEKEINLNEFGYEEYQSGDFFSIADQKTKGVSAIPALTITMSPEFSDQNFEQADDISLDTILQKFKIKYPVAKVIHSELKKWRYCRPLKTYKSLFIKAAPQFYCIGDAFGGSSLLGAIRSSESVCMTLMESH